MGALDFFKKRFFRENDTVNKSTTYGQINTRGTFKNCIKIINRFTCLVEYWTWKSRNITVWLTTCLDSAAFYNLNYQQIYLLGWMQSSITGGQSFRGFSIYNWSCYYLIGCECYKVGNFFDHYQCDRLGDVWKFLATNFATKVPQVFDNLLCYYKSITL